MADIYIYIYIYIYMYMKRTKTNFDFNHIDKKLMKISEMRSNPRTNFIAKHFSYTGEHINISND